MAAHLRIEDPKEITQEIDLRRDDASFAYRTEEPRTNEIHIPAKISAVKRFNPKLFTKRELRLMEQLAFIYKEATAKQMSEVSHLKGKPWHLTRTKHGLKAPILNVAWSKSRKN